ncbi:hypothetical protein HanRHA438_Chr04g0202411 [Helianthus annuus]|nr:hypothetical protein HanRHA438_Chr04g0202411 [Helianthus annuus]
MKKGGASLFMKNIISQLSSLAKSKSLAIKRKVESIKARVIICSLSKNKKLPLSISHKIHALLLGAQPHWKTTIIKFSSQLIMLTTSFS